MEILEIKHRDFDALIHNVEKTSYVLDIHGQNRISAICLL